MISFLWIMFFLNNVCYYGFYRNMYLVTEIYFKFIS